MNSHNINNSLNIMADDLIYITNILISIINTDIKGIVIKDNSLKSKMKYDRYSIITNQFAFIYTS